MIYVKKFIGLAWFLSVFCLSDTQALQADTEAPTPAKLTDVTYIGSHNSYKRAIEPRLLTILRWLDEDTANSLDYHHKTLEAQLALGIRLFELDVFYDPKGGLYANPFGARWPFAKQGLTPEMKDLLRTPGFKVLHAQDIDYQSHCITFRQCLESFASFSDDNANHEPIIVTLNLKASPINLPGFAHPLAFDHTAFLALEAEILSVLARPRLFSPEDLQGAWPTLATAVERDGWPLFNELRDRFIFVLDESEAKLANYSQLVREHKAGLLFKTPPLGHPDAAILVLNDPIGMAREIQSGTELGYLVRTRADADTVEARSNDIKRRNAAFRSGAQLISTDYYLPDPRFNGNYQVQFSTGGYIEIPSN